MDFDIAMKCIVFLSCTSTCTISEYKPGNLENQQSGLTIWDIESVKHVSTGEIWADWILPSKKGHENICHRKLCGKDTVHYSVSL